MTEIDFSNFLNSKFYEYFISRNTLVPVLGLLVCKSLQNVCQECQFSRRKYESSATAFDIVVCISSEHERNIRVCDVSYQTS